MFTASFDRPLRRADLLFALLILLMFTACRGAEDATTEAPSSPATAAPGELPPESELVTEPVLETPATEPVQPTETATVIPPEGAQEAAAGPDDPTSLLNLMAAGELQIAGVTAITDAQLVGQALQVTLSNPGSLNVVVTIPCGLVFTPQEAGPRLMVAESVTLTIPAGAGADVIPNTISLDADASPPPEGAIYTVGEMAEDWQDQCAP